jgi:hypothetical protein
MPYLLYLPQKLILDNKINLILGHIKRIETGIGQSTDGLWCQANLGDDDSSTTSKSSVLIVLDDTNQTTSK